MQPLKHFPGKAVLFHFVPLFLFLIPADCEVASHLSLYWSSSSCCSFPCTQVRPMYSQRRSLGRKLVCDLRGERQEREAELRGGGSGARGVRGRAVRRRPLTPSIRDICGHGSPRWDWPWLRLVLFVGLGDFCGTLWHEYKTLTTQAHYELSLQHRKVNQS